LAPVSSCTAGAPGRLYNDSPTRTIAPGQAGCARHSLLRWPRVVYN